MALRVGVNLLWCRPGRVGGSEEYLARQLVGLAAVAPEVTARLLVPPGFAAAHPELAGRFELVTGRTVTRYRGARLLAESLTGARAFSGAVSCTTPGARCRCAEAPRRRCSRSTTCSTSPTRSTSRPPVAPTSVTACHVLSLGRRQLRCRASSSPTRWAKRSGSTRDKSWSCRTATTHLAPSSLPPTDELRRRYRLGDRRVVVYPAITHPHKGHRLLVDLLAGPWADPDLVVVFLGGAGAADDAVSTAIATRGVGERIVRTGRVTAADRDGLIALAEALVFPSEYEGFGAPVLEAMALGTPVLCSDRGALPEVAGDAAVVRPPTVDDWADALADARRTA